MSQDVRERFNKSVAEHEMIVVQNDGLHRHLTFKNPDTFNNHFHITTWPGYLAISGDIGCYVFARLPDMFKFFRHDEINPGYWGEKLQSIERNGGYREFSEDLFRDAIKSDFEQWSFDDDDQRAKALEALEAADLGEDSNPESFEHGVRMALDYKCPVTGNRFNDFWDHTLEDFTFRFLWCCHAIRWAVAEYDRRTVSSAIVATPRGGCGQLARAPELGSWLLFFVICRQILQGSFTS